MLAVRVLATIVTAAAAAAASAAESHDLLSAVLRRGMAEALLSVLEARHQHTSSLTMVRILDPLTGLQCHSCLPAGSSNS